MARLHLDLAQALGVDVKTVALTIQGSSYLADTPNILAVPSALLRNPFGRAAVRGAIDD